LVSKDDLKRIIDITTQTKIFDNLELANVKAVQLALKKRKIKRTSHIKSL
jgi:hypothetical protein